MKLGLPGEPTPDGSQAPHVRVSWGVDHGDVQVASLFDRAHGADVILETVNQWLTAAGLPQIPGREELAGLIAANADPDSLAAQFGVGFEGFYTTLGERRDLNRLIQVLKRARDGAFGRDE